VERTPAQRRRLPSIVLPSAEFASSTVQAAHPRFPFFKDPLLTPKERHSLIAHAALYGINANNLRYNAAALLFTLPLSCLIVRLLNAGATSPAPADHMLPAAGTPGDGVVSHRLLSFVLTHVLSYAARCEQQPFVFAWMAGFLHLFACDLRAALFFVRECVLQLIHEHAAATSTRPQIVTNSLRPIPWLQLFFLGCPNPDLLAAFALLVMVALRTVLVFGAWEEVELRWRRFAPPGADSAPLCPATDDYLAIDSLPLQPQATGSSSLARPLYSPALSLAHSLMFALVSLLPRAQMHERSLLQLVYMLRDIARWGTLPSLLLCTLDLPRRLCSFPSSRSRRTRSAPTGAST
jgi:hypothetical protein